LWDRIRATACAVRPPMRAVSPPPRSLCSQLYHTPPLSCHPSQEATRTYLSEGRTANFIHLGSTFACSAHTVHILCTVGTLFSSIFQQSTKFLGQREESENESRHKHTGIKPHVCFPVQCIDNCQAHKPQGVRQVGCQAETSASATHSLREGQHPSHPSADP